MKILKNTIAFIFVAGALAYTGYSIYFYSLGPCEKPLEYAIGRFDTQFGVAKEEFKSRIAVSETVWEKVLNRDVFLYDPDAAFKINLIYDERQLATIQKQKTEFGLSAVEDILNKLDAEFSEMKTSYDRASASHEARSISLESRQKEYARDVDFWNKKGGAPKNEYEKLQAEAAALNREVAAFNVEAASLNTEAQELNALLQKRNQAAAEYNKIAKNYNQKYGQGLEFNQAEYTGNEINVYQFGNKGDLAVALTHELGHALGMDHVENPASIMYYISGDNAATVSLPSAEDLAELRRVCGE